MLINLILKLRKFKTDHQGINEEKLLYLKLECQDIKTFSCPFQLKYKIED
jgi:hypothetical protein